MADNPTPQVVQPTVNWASLSQTVFLGLLAALQGVQFATKPADGIPPAPAPVINAATLHDDNLRAEKKLDAVLEILNTPAPKK